MLSYKDCPIHRINKDGWVQSGDIVNKVHIDASPVKMPTRRYHPCLLAQDGSGGISANDVPIPDESFAIPHDRAGLLGMCKTRNHTATSQFYITLASHPGLDRSYVAFGRLIDGYLLSSRPLPWRWTEGRVACAQLGGARDARRDQHCGG